MYSLRFKLDIQLFGGGDEKKGDSQGKNPPDEKDTNSSKSVEELTSKVEELTSSVEGLKDDLEKAKAESEKSKKEVENLKKAYQDKYVSDEEEHAHDDSKKGKPVGLFEAIINAKKR